jgi:Mce-associated membrane protein
MAADLARAESEMTPSFRQSFASTAASLAAEARQVKAIVQATPAGPAGVVNAAADRVVVLLFIDQAAVKQTPGATTPTTRLDQERVQLTMTRSGGRWLVADIAAL